MECFGVCEWGIALFLLGLLLKWVYVDIFNVGGDLWVDIWLGYLGIQGNPLHAQRVEEGLIFISDGDRGLGIPVVACAQLGGKGWAYARRRMFFRELKNFFFFFKVVWVFLRGVRFGYAHELDGKGLAWCQTLDRSGWNTHTAG